MDTTKVYKYERMKVINTKLHLFPELNGSCSNILVCGDVFEEVEERFAHPSVRVHHINLSI